MQPLVMPGQDGLHDFMDHSQDKFMWLHVFGRRKPGVSIAQVQAEMNVLFRQILEAEYSTSMTPLARKDALNQEFASGPCDREHFTVVKNSRSSGPSCRP